MRPENQSMIWWRKKGDFGFKFGYVVHLPSPDLIRLGSYNGHMEGIVVLVDDIEWRPY